MKEPRRWLDSRSSSVPIRLLRSVVDEPLPQGAMLRAAMRFGISATAISVSSASLAQATAASSLATGANVAAATAVGKAAILVALTKGIIVGLGVGALMVGAAQLRPSQGSVVAAGAPSTQQVVSTPKSTTRAVLPAVEVAQASPTATSEPPASQPTTPSTDPSRARSAPLARPRGRSAMTTIRPLPASTASSEIRGLSDSPRSVALARFADVPAVAVNADLQPASSPSVPIAIAPPPTLRQASLAQEVRALDRVRQALRSGEAAGALAELMRSRQQRVFRRLSREAEILRVEAMGAVGQNRNAATLARQLLSGDVSPAQRKSLERWSGSSGE